MAVALIPSATTNVRSESRPGPVPTAKPNVWVDQNSTRQCELNFPCVGSVAIQGVSRGVDHQGGNGTVFRDSEVRPSGGVGLVALDATNTTVDNVASFGGGAGIVAQGVQGFAVSRSQLTQAGGWGMLVA